MDTETLECGFKKPPAVFRTMEKIRVASYRVGFNLWDLYKPLDPDQNNLISTSKFISVLGGPLKEIIGISNDEIIQVAQYFRNPDGRVMYTQFCDLVHGDRTDKKIDVKTDELYKSNKLSPEDEKYILMMLTKIAVLLNNKKMLIKPFFQDHSLVSKGSGLMSRAHFARVLSYMGIEMSNKDYQLLLRKYTRDAYTLSYVAFLKDLDDVRNYLEEHDVLDTGGDLLPRFPGRLETHDLPALPRPEIVPPEEGPDQGLAKLSSMAKQVSPVDLMGAIEKIRQHLAKEKVRIGRLLEVYDTTCCGRVTIAQFRLALQKASETARGYNFLHLTNEEVKNLIRVYADPTDCDRILWRVFTRDIEAGFDSKELETWDEQRMALLRDVCDWHKRGHEKFVWSQTEHPAPPPVDYRQVLRSLKRKLIKRNIHLKPTFLKYDRERMGHVDRYEFRDVLIDNCILCTDEEIELLEKEYIRGGNFNYSDLLHDLDKISLGEQDISSLDFKTAEEILNKREKEKKKEEQARESGIIEVLAKIKSKLICNKRNTLPDLKTFDQANSKVISVPDFQSALSKCSISLTPTELETIIDVFKNPNQPTMLEYEKFSYTVDEPSERPCLKWRPLKEVMEYHEEKPMPVEHPFMNFHERSMLSVAMKKLSTKLSLGSLDAFKKMDEQKRGTVSRLQLLTLLYSMGILHQVTMIEVDNIIKGFGIMSEGESSYGLDYLSFLNALDIIYRTKKASMT